MPEKNGGVVLNQKLIGILDGLLTAGDWETSFFLKKAKDRLTELRSEAQNFLEQNTERQLSGKAQPTNGELPAGFVKVYVSVYQTDSSNLQSWLYAIKGLVSYNVTRPTYRNENQIKEMVSSKADIQRNGYVEVLIHESDIIQVSSPSVDAFGHELLVVKEGAIQMANIVAFVHANKVRYKLQNNNLVFDSDIKS